MRIPPTSPAFTVLLGLLAVVPGFGVDMALPSLAAAGASLGVSSSAAGLTISCFMVSFGLAPLIYGPVSDRYGRKPIVVSGCVVFVIAGVGCAFAPSLPVLLACRIVQGAGAAGMTLVMAIVRDLFDGPVAREKMSYIIIAIYVSPIVAPTAGAVLLGFGGWRLIYVALVTLGLILALGMDLGFEERARPDRSGRFNPATIVRNYACTLLNTVCRGYMIVSAASFGVLMAYATGSSLFFIKIVGLSPHQYGLLFGATAMASVVGALFDSRLSARRLASAYPLTIGLATVALASVMLLVMTLVHWMPLPLVISIFLLITFSAGIVAPGITQGIMEPLPEIAGTVSAATNCVSIMSGALCSGLTTILFDGRSTLSMATVMTICSLLAMAFYLVTRRSAALAALRSRVG